MKRFFNLAKLRRALIFLKVAIRRRIKLGSTAYTIHAFSTNSLARICVSRWSYEKSLDKVYRAALAHRQGAFVDVGANVGQTLIKVLEIDPDRTYIGFEPQQLACAFMAEFINQNRLQNHMVFSLGLSNRRGICKIGLRETNDVAASTIDEFRPSGFYSYYQFVPVVQGDEVFPALGIDNVAVMKIDVEGGELEVMQGCLQTFRRCKPVVIFEVLPDYLLITRQELNEQIKRHRAQRYAAIKDLLNGIGYTVMLQDDDIASCHDAQVCADSRRVKNYVAVNGDDLEAFQESYRKL